MMTTQLAHSPVMYLALTTAIHALDTATALCDASHSGLAEDLIALAQEIEVLRGEEPSR